MNVMERFDRIFLEINHVGGGSSGDKRRGRDVTNDGLVEDFALSITLQTSHIKTINKSISLLETSFYSREKKSSSTHQNNDASFPNQETLTSHPCNPTHSKEPPQYMNHKLPEYKKATPNTAI